MPLFHPRLIKEITNKPLVIPPKHFEVLETWVKSIQTMSIYKVKETSLSGEFRQKILANILGYKTYTDQNIYNLYPEYKLGTGSVDVALGFFNRDAPEENIIVAPLELKGAKTRDLDAIMPGRNKSPVQQAWEYGMDAKGAKWVMVTNYLELRLYAIGYGRQVYERFMISDLLDTKEYTRFITLLSSDNLLGDYTYDLLVQSEKVDKEITSSLYQDYKSLRLKLISALENDNKDVSTLEAIRFGQTILDRILFIAFAEDKGLLPDRSIEQAYEHADPYNPKHTWENFKGLFRAIDQGNTVLNIPQYNGGLFKQDEAIEHLNVSDQVCEEFRDLARYDFNSEVGVTILGHIFEQSISDIEGLQARAEGGKPIAEAKGKTTGKRKKEGVVYTPDSITRFIVEKTLGEYLNRRFEDLKVENTQWYFKSGERAGEFRTEKVELQFWRTYQDILRKTRVVDPACGSGAFLVAAFDFLYEEYTRVNKRIAELRGGTGDVFDLDKEILNNNLYGVDINAESIEITKLSLWLKTAQRGKVLNSLDDNLCVGDSLIEDSNYSFRAFTWKEAFPEVFADGGFDVVLGNPPYVRQEFISPLKPYLEKRYEVYNGVADLYTYFFELGLRILKPSTGRLGYISSATFFKTSSGQKLRAYLSANTELDSIVDFGDVQIFEGVTTYPAIFVIDNNKPAKEHRIEFLTITETPKEDINKTYAEYAQQMPQLWLNSEQWNFQSEDLYRLLKKIKAEKKTLAKAYNSPQYGIKTGYNEAFVIDQELKSELVEEDPKATKIIKPFLEGKDFKTWRVEPREKYLLFTRRGINIESYRSVYNHLVELKARLMPKPKSWSKEKKWEGRKAGSYEWYELQDTVDYFENFDSPKIMYGHFSPVALFSYDNKGFYSNDKSYIIPNSDYYLLGLLNSKVIWLYLKSICPFVRGGYYELRIQYVETIPIPEATDEQKALIGELAEKAQEAAEARYAIQEQVRKRIHDLAPEDWNGKLNTKLKEWWTLNFKSFRAEAKKVFKQDIALAERDDWEVYLKQKRANVDDLTAKLIDTERQLNEHIYRLFDMSVDEIALIEKQTLTNSEI